MPGRRRAVGVVIALLTVFLVLFNATGPADAARPADGTSRSSVTPLEDEQAVHAPVVRTIHARRITARPIPAMHNVGISVFAAAGVLLTLLMLRTSAFARGPDNLGRRILILHGIHRC